MPLTQCDIERQIYDLWLLVLTKGTGRAQVEELLAPPALLGPQGGIGATGAIYRSLCSPS